MTYAEKDLVTTIDRLVSESSIGRTTPEELHLLDRYRAPHLLRLCQPLGGTSPSCRLHLGHRGHVHSR